MDINKAECAHTCLKKKGEENTKRIRSYCLSSDDRPVILSQSRSLVRRASIRAYSRVFSRAGSLEEESRKKSSRQSSVMGRRAKQKKSLNSPLPAIISLHSIFSLYLASHATCSIFDLPMWCRSGKARYGPLFVVVVVVGFGVCLFYNGGGKKCPCFVHGLQEVKHSFPYLKPSLLKLQILILLLTHI